MPQQIKIGRRAQNNKRSEISMQPARIEKEGYKPIMPDLKRIDALQDKKELIKLIAEKHLSGVAGFFGFFVTADAKKSNLMAPHLSQGGIGLQDVEYYTKDDARSKDIREKYVQYAANMFKLIDVDAATVDKYAQTIMSIETRFAKASNTRLENRDPLKTYNKMTIENLKNISDGFNWDSYFESLGVEGLKLVIVSQPKFFTELGKMIDDISLDDWKIYLKWNLVRSTAPALSSSFVNEQFNFNGRFMAGTKAMQPRWKRILQSVNGAMGEMVGQLYVKEVFPPESKARAKAIVNNLLISMGE